MDATTSSIISYVFYFSIIQFCSIKAQFTTGMYFKQIKGANDEISVRDTKPVIDSEFFHCDIEQSCTHLLNLANKYVIAHGSEELGRRKDSALSIYEKVKLQARSCIDFYHAGMRKNGLYEVQDEKAAPFRVFCDFESEVNSVWTLVTSYSPQNSSLFNAPFYSSSPRKAIEPNWFDYRLGLQRMKSIRSASTMWRATCSFPKYKSDVYRDYMKVDLDKFDPFAVASYAVCQRVAYINTRGHEGWNITIPIWNIPNLHLHTDSSRKRCEFDAVQGSVHNEDNFGFYGTFNGAFRCTESDESTTQYWIGVTI